MANVTRYQHFGETWGNEVGLAHVFYDFSVDTGAQGTYDLGDFTHKTLIVKSVVHVETAMTTSASGTLEFGGTTAGHDVFMAHGTGTAGNLVDDYAYAGGDQDVVFAANEEIRATIATGDLTAGKVHLYLWYKSVD